MLVAFRDREAGRVARFLGGMAGQTFRDFEVVFLDYGSQPELAAEVEKLTAARPFVRYVYNQTRGRPWNRAHALNSAARLSAGAYLLCTDIDLVYSRDALAALAGAAEPQTSLGGAFQLLPRNFSAWDRLPGGEIQGLPASHAHTLGAIQLVPRDAFFRTGGFDEFFRLWGVEDFEFQERLARSGCRPRRLELPPIYHQWHPSAAVPPMPRGWLELMTFRALTREPAPPAPAWGQRLTEGDRPSLSADLTAPAVRRYALPEPGLAGEAAWAKIAFLRRLLRELAAAPSGAVFLCEVSNPLGRRLRALLARTLLRRRFRPLGGRRFFDVPREGREVLWYVAQFAPAVADFRLEDDGRTARYVLVRR